MKTFLYTLLLFIPVSLFSQATVNIYNPLADANKEIAMAVQAASDQHKHVLIQVGGNWCPWCVRLHGFFESNVRADSILHADYVYILVNYSPENKNPEVMSSLGYPQRFGFPVLLVLDAKGQRLHTQNTAYLEKDKSYDTDKIIGFLLDWNVSALNPVTNKQ